MLGFEGVFTVDARGHSGGVSLLWRNQNDLEVLGYSIYHIDVRITTADKKTWRLTGMYSEPNHSQRYKTWNLLRTLTDESSLPWCVIGDMNNIVSHSDKKGGNWYPNGLIEGFQKALSDCHPVDLELHGYPLLGNGVVEITSSDHCPLLLDLVNQNERLCVQVIQDSWDANAGGSITKKIKRCGESLTSWGNEFTGNIKYRIKRCKSDIKRLKRLRDDASMAEFKIAEKRLAEVLTQRELFWKQRSKQLWLRVRDSNRLEDAILSYFSELFTSTSSLTDVVVAGISPSISNSQNRDLLSPVLEEEIKSALFQMHPDKSRGPDGMTPGSTKNVGMWLVMMWCYKSRTSLIQIEDYAPPNLSENQLAFILSRLISDNIMVSYEVVHYFKRKRKGKTGYMALKLDLSKAYDRIERGFLWAMMRTMGFHTGLSSLIKRFERSGHIRGCKVANGVPTISHMLFANDSYVYCQATENEADNVLRLLHMFEMASGQQVNRAKSSIFFSANTPFDLRDRLCARMGMVPASDQSVYLGLPCILGRRKKAIQNFLQEKMEKRILSWEGRFLCKAGREILLKTVVQAIPSYDMSVFLLPIETCTLLERLMSKYWWGTSSQRSRGITWIKWSRLSRYKSSGGLGFRNLKDYNLSLLGKQVWHLLQGEDSLVGRVYKARYFPNC
ncbi:uncharacterized protein LOC115723580 [Cannabis sativa]|uniref:uncharacterized protein LOC115723580 n=1 Tax=Cannabis sativa TaxID=3483 RepID=UPI0029CAAB74|nr:uncharacterized protein LOC115723580 [Cannabis sativa]